MRDYLLWLLAPIIAAAIAPVVALWLQRRKGGEERSTAEITDSGKFRSELWERIEFLETALEETRKRYEAALDDLRARYDKLQTELYALHAENRHLKQENERLTRDGERLKVRVAELERANRPT